MIKNRSLLRSIEKDHLETFAALTKRREIEKPVCWRRPVFASQRPVPTSSGKEPLLGTGYENRVSGSELSKRFMNIEKPFNG